MCEGNRLDRKDAGYPLLDQGPGVAGVPTRDHSARHDTFMIGIYNPRPSIGSGFYSITAYPRVFHCPSRLQAILS